MALAGTGALRVVAQDLDVAPRGRVRVVGLEPRRAVLVELQLGRVDDHVGARELAELEQLGVGERGLRRPAAAEHDDLLARDARQQRVERVVGGVGGRELVGVEHEHARDVDRDVAVADDDRAPRRQVELVVGVVGVAVVPGDELRRGVRARAGPRPGSRAGCRRGADRVDDRVVALEQVRARDVAAELDAAEEAEAAGAPRSSRRRA